MGKEKLCFFDTKPYDKEFFENYNKDYGFEIQFFEEKLNFRTAIMAAGSTTGVLKLVKLFVCNALNGKLKIKR